MHLDLFSAAAPGDALARFPLCQTTNIDEAVEWCQRIFCENEIATTAPGGKFNAQIFYRKLGAAGIGRMGYGGDVRIEPSTFETFVLFQVPIRGQEFIESDGRSVVCTPSQGVVLNAQAKTVLRHCDNTEKLFVRVDSELLQTSCQQAIGRPLSKPIEFQPEMSMLDSDGRQWMRTVRWLFDMLSTDAGDEVPALMRSQMERSLAVALLLCQPNNYSAELRHGAERSIAPRFVKRAVSYIEEHAHEPITIGDIASHVNVSTRSLYAGFRRYRDTSPMQYLKEVRLHHINEELKATSPSKGAVATAAFNWGFNHLGHFSADYKRLFGETPAQTLMR